MDVKTALDEFEVASEGLVAADASLTAASTKEADAAAKLAAAKEATSVAVGADVEAESHYNASVDNLIDALISTKRVSTSTFTV